MICTSFPSLNRAIAGEEGGFPPKKHIDAFHYIQRENFNITIHAGEAFGKESIWQAIQWCGAHRIGHGTRLIDDMTADPSDPTTIVKMGDLAQYVLGWPPEKVPFMSRTRPFTRGAGAPNAFFASSCAQNAPSSNGSES